MLQLPGVDSLGSGGTASWAGSGGPAIDGTTVYWGWNEICTGLWGRISGPLSTIMDCWGTHSCVGCPGVYRQSLTLLWWIVHSGPSQPHAELCAVRRECRDNNKPTWRLFYFGFSNLSFFRDPSLQRAEQSHSFPTVASHIPGPLCWEYFSTVSLAHTNVLWCFGLILLLGLSWWVDQLPSWHPYYKEASRGQWAVFQL